MDPLNKIPGIDETEPPELRDDETVNDWAEEDREIEGRKPDLSEMDEDPTEI